MHIEELEEGEVVVGEGQQGQDHDRDHDNKSSVGISCGNSVVVWDTKRVLVGAGARALFYPTLLYNVVRNKVQSEFRWWDRVDEFVLLGAVPFPADVTRLKELGVSRVVTLNENYETLVPTSLYHAHGIEHLVIPTRDYLFAPSFTDICQAVDFIHENSTIGKATYVHCKAGRGRSTTIVLCYLVEHRKMTPDAAYEYVRSIRPRVLLASSQRQAVYDYYLCKVVKNVEAACSMEVRPTLTFGEHDIETFDDRSLVIVTEPTPTLEEQDIETFDDTSLVIVTESDLDGYETSCASDVAPNQVISDIGLACKVQFASQAAFARLSILWPRCPNHQKESREKLGESVGADQLGNLNVDIRVY